MVRRILLLVVGVLLISGCGGDPEPKVARPAPSAAAASASPTVSESAEPETAEAFIRRLVRANTEMQNTGQSATYRLLLSGCEACLKTADQVDQFYAAGGSVRIRGQKVRDVRFISGTTYEVDVVSGPTKYTRAAGAAEESFPGGPTTYEMTLLNSNGVWTISDSTRLAR